MVMNVTQPCQTSLCGFGPFAGKGADPQCRIKGVIRAVRAVCKELICCFV